MFVKRASRRPRVVQPARRRQHAFARQMPRASLKKKRVHHGHMPEIEILDSTTARGVWALYDCVSWSPERELTGYGHYHETSRKTPGGQWQIASLLLTRLRVDASGNR